MICRLQHGCSDRAISFNNKLSEFKENEMPNDLKKRVALYVRNVTPTKLKKIMSKVEEKVEDRSSAATFLDADDKVLPADRTPTKAVTPSKREYTDFTDYDVNDKGKKRRIRLFMPDESTSPTTCPKVEITKVNISSAKRVLNFDTAENQLGEFLFRDIPPGKRKVPRSALPQQNSVMEGLSAREVITISKMLEKEPDLEKCDDAELKKLSDEVNYTEEAHHSHGHAVSLTPNSVDPQVATNIPSATSATNMSSKRIEAAAKELVKKGKYPDATYSGSSKCKEHPNPGNVFAGRYMPVAKTYLYRFRLGNLEITQTLAADRKTVISKAVKFITKEIVDVYFDEASKSTSSPAKKV